MKSVATQEAPVKEQQRTQAYVAPEVNVYETSDAYVIEAEMPGVSKDGLEITLDGTDLTILGRRNHEDLKADLLFRESSKLDYRRAFEIDPAVDTSKIDAKLEQGVLTLRLPKSERVKPRKIEVGD